MLQGSCTSAMVRSTFAVPTATTGAVHRTMLPMVGSCSSTVAAATCTASIRRLGSPCVVCETDNLTNLNLFDNLPRSGRIFFRKNDFKKNDNKRDFGN